MKVLWIVIPLLLTGCAGFTVPPNQVYSIGAANNIGNSVEVVDKRLEASKQFRKNTNGGVTYYLGDSNLQPSRIEILKSRLSSQLSSTKFGEPIVVEEFDVYLMDLTGYAGQSSNAAPGVDPASILLGSSIIKMAFSEDPIAGCNITVRYKNQRINRTQSKSFSAPKIDESLNDVISKTISQIADQINSQ
jgi:hypothetical protein